MSRRLLMSFVIIVCLGQSAIAQEGFPAGTPPVGGMPDSAGLYADETESLRRRLLQITMERASGMTDEELQRAIANAESERTELPPAAVEIMESYKQRAAATKKEANRKINAFKKETIEDLKVVQEQYTKQGLLDEAVAVRDLIRALKTPPFTVRPDPGSMTAFQNQIGKTFYFKVTGAVGGPLWGTKVYTSDSNLASAAVQTGVLKNGQTGLVKVTMLAGQNKYAGTANLNGVSSSSYGQYPSSYRVDAVEQD